MKSVDCVHDMRANTATKKFAFIGPRLHKHCIGGAVWLFEDLISATNGGHMIFDSNSSNYRNRFYFLAIFLKFIIMATVSGREISLHGSARDFKYFGPILLLFRVCFGMRYHTRKFAGNFDRLYLGYGRFWQVLIAAFLKRSKNNFFETKHLVEYFQNLNPNTFWMPNYRPSVVDKCSSKFDGKLVFVGRLTRDKGVDFLFSIASTMPSKWSIDFYGPLIDYSESDFLQPNANYCGIVEKEQVPSTIAKYDLLVLPTIHDGEGYPGVLIEAFSVGLPVVTTNWRSISEIVNDSCGCLADPFDQEGLLKCIFNVVNCYEKKCVGAKNMFDIFDRTKVLDKYFCRIGYFDK